MGRSNKYSVALVVALIPFLFNGLKVVSVEILGQSALPRTCVTNSDGLRDSSPNVSVTLLFFANSY